jgi:hypothetical protein
MQSALGACDHDEEDAMKLTKRILTGFAALSVTLTPSAGFAQQHRDDRYDRQDRHDRHDRRDNVDAGDVITGVAILGGIAAIAAASDRDGRYYGRNGRHRYRNDYRNAVNACGHEAERYGRGGVQITYVDRRGENKYRVKGMIRAGYGTRYERWGAERSRWGCVRNRNRYFSCTARRNGRVTDFDLNGRDIW